MTRGEAPQLQQISNTCPDTDPAPGPDGGDQDPLLLLRGHRPQHPRRRHDPHQPRRGLRPR